MSSTRSIYYNVLETLVGWEEPWLHQCATIEEAHAIRVGLKRAQKRLAQTRPEVAGWKIGLKGRMVVVDQLGRTTTAKHAEKLNSQDEAYRTELRVAQTIKEDFENGEFNLSHAVALAEDAGVRGDIIKEVLGNATDTY